MALVAASDAFVVAVFELVFADACDVAAAAADAVLSAALLVLVAEEATEVSFAVSDAA